jgi:hypothetical protein
VSRNKRSDATPINTGSTNRTTNARMTAPRAARTARRQLHYRPDILRLAQQ